jgi:hypothetical protein
MQHVEIFKSLQAAVVYLGMYTRIVKNISTALLM